MGNPGGDDDVESIGPGGHDDVVAIGSGGPVERYPLQPLVVRGMSLSLLTLILLRVGMMK